MTSANETLAAKVQHTSPDDLTPQEIQQLLEMGTEIFKGIRYIPLTLENRIILLSWLQTQTDGSAYRKLVAAATAVLDRKATSMPDKELVRHADEVIVQHLPPDKSFSLEEERIMKAAAFFFPEPSTPGASTVSKSSVYPESLAAALDRLDVTGSQVHNHTPSEHERIGAFMTSRCDIFAVGDEFLLPNKMPALPSPAEFTRDDLPNDVKSLQQAIKNRLDVERDVGEFLIRNRMILYQLKIKEMLLRKE